MSDRQAYITLDLENDWYVDAGSDEYQTFEYIDQYIEMVDSVNVPVTVFVVGKTLEDRPEDVERIRSGLRTEFHLHSYHHEPNMNGGFRDDLYRGIDTFQAFFGKKPTGYRAPLGKISPERLRVLANEGFSFDSSVFPSYRPGVYNNLGAPTEPYSPPTAPNLTEFPIAVCSRFRVPISQSYLKLLGQPFKRYIRWSSLPDQTVFVSHLHDFFDTPAHEHRSSAMRSIHRRNIDRSPLIFEEFVDHLRGRGFEFGHLGSNAIEAR